MAVTYGQWRDSDRGESDSGDAFAETSEEVDLNIQATPAAPPTLPDSFIGSAEPDAFTAEPFTTSVEPVAPPTIRTQPSRVQPNVTASQPIQPTTRQSEPTAPTTRQQEPTPAPVAQEYSGRTPNGVTSCGAEPVCTVNVRSSPNGSIIVNLPMNTGIYVTNVTSGAWTQVITPSGRYGYVYTSLITRR